MLAIAPLNPSLTLTPTPSVKSKSKFQGLGPGVLGSSEWSMPHIYSSIKRGTIKDALETTCRLTQSFLSCKVKRLSLICSRTGEISLSDFSSLFLTLNYKYFENLYFDKHLFRLQRQTYTIEKWKKLKMEIFSRMNQGSNLKSFRSFV